MLKVLSWNVAGRLAKLDRQVDFIAGRGPDVVALQEVSPKSGARLSDALSVRAQLPHVRLSLPLDPTPVSRRRSLGVLVASRFPLSSCDSPIHATWPEKALSVQVETPTGSFDLHTVHVPPGSSNGWVKIEVMESVIEALGRDSDVPRILTGDFNAPQAELPDGTLVTWAQRFRPDGSVANRARFRGAPAARWDEAERAVLVGLQKYGLTDSFRKLHGYGREGVSWPLRNVRGSFPRRFDHLFASDAFVVGFAEYLSAATDATLSDHRPLEVWLESAGLLTSI